MFVFAPTPYEDNRNVNRLRRLLVWLPLGLLTWGLLIAFALWLLG